MLKVAIHRVKPEREQELREWLGELMRWNSPMFRRHSRRWEDLMARAVLLLKKLERLAARKDSSLSAVVQQILARFLEKSGNSSRQKGGIE